jgi:hypothetical protein
VLTALASLSVLMGRLRKLAMAGGAFVGPQLGDVLGEGGVADVGECFDLRVLLDHFGEVGGGPVGPSGW